MFQMQWMKASTQEWEDLGGPHETMEEAIKFFSFLLAKWVVHCAEGGEIDHQAAAEAFLKFNRITTPDGSILKPVSTNVVVETQPTVH